VQDYPPLVDTAGPGCQTAQYVRPFFPRLLSLALEPPLTELSLSQEHTIILRPNCKEIVTRGDDY